MSEISHAIGAILEKSLLLLGLVYIAWIVWVVPNDRRRARNTAILVFTLALIFFSWLFFQQRKIAGTELNNFHYVINEKITAAERLTALKDSFSLGLSELQTEYDRIAAENQRLGLIVNDAALSESQRSLQYSDQFTKILGMLDELEVAANLCRRDLDATVRQCATVALFTDSSATVMRSILSHLQSSGSFNLAGILNDAHVLQFVHTEIAQKADSLIRQLHQMQSAVSAMDERIASTRRELLKNVKIVFVGVRQVS